MPDVGRSWGVRQGSQAGGQRDGHLDTGIGALIHPLTQCVGHPVGNKQSSETTKNRHT